MSLKKHIIMMFNKTIATLINIERTKTILTFFASITMLGLVGFSYKYKKKLLINNTFLI